MDCRQFRKRHTTFVEGTMSARATSGMYEHLDGCERCAAFDAVVRRGLLVARNLPAIEPSRDFNARLQARLRAAAADTRPASDWVEPRSVGRRLLNGIRVAAAMGVIAVGLSAMHSRPRPYAVRAEAASDSSGPAAPAGHATRTRPSGIAPGLAAALTLGLPTWPPGSVELANGQGKSAPMAFQTASLSP
jgi:hypothetical protein